MTTGAKAPTTKTINPEGRNVKKNLYPNGGEQRNDYCCAGAVDYSIGEIVPRGGKRPGTGGAREGAGRKKNKVELKRHVLTFSDEEWVSMVEAAGGERKVARYLAGLHEKTK